MLHRPLIIPLLVAAGLWAGSARPADPPRVSVLTGAQVVQILDETVDWYRTLGTQQQNATQPSDLLILFGNRQTADQVVALAFDIARANAELLSSEAAAPDSHSQQRGELDAQRALLEINDARQRHLDSKLLELQGELAMLDARRNLLDTMAGFVDSSDPKAAGVAALKSQIDAIAATVPTSDLKAPAAVSAALPASRSRNGLWDLGITLLRQRNKVETIDVIDRRTAALARTFTEISAPPLARLKGYSARSDALAAQADTANSGALKSLRGEYDTLAWLFKQTSDIVVPLNKEQVLLQQYRHNLGSWRESSERQYHEASTALAIRAGIVAGILLAIFAVGEVWRRATVRYVHDPRRRNQVLLIRNFVQWIAFVVVIGLSFVTEISSFATFAGLLTAGLAVAMQSVLVSVVGYFFLIGKYGIRVGDRIQIGTVAGEVIDLGLVRMHLMELNQQGPLGPTGRVVAFANLVVFQASGGLFKHIPGVNLSWHETTLILPQVEDYAGLKQRLLAAISAIVGEYRDEITRQTREIEKSTASSSVSDATPSVQMHLANGRMEALIRWPVHLQHAAEIDERVAEAVLKVISQSV
jgi:small-conductance mechanosensitive channel